MHIYGVNYLVSNSFTCPLEGWRFLTPHLKEISYTQSSKRFTFEIFTYVLDVTGHQAAPQSTDRAGVATED